MDNEKKKKTQKGEELLNQLIHLTGIPGKTIRQELKDILERKKIDINNLTLDQLRSVVASYMREIMSGILDRSNTNDRSKTHH